MEYNIVVVGASGQVGCQVVKELEERSFPVKKLLAFASKDSIAESVEFLGEEIAVQELDSSAFTGADIVFFCTPAQITTEYLQTATQAGAFCIDLSRASIGDSAVPCIVSELSSTGLLKSLNRVANPPVAAIQAALILAPLQEKFGLKQASLTVMQSASALGNAGVEMLRKQSGALLNARPLDSAEVEANTPAQLAYNLVPVNAGGENYAGADEIGDILRQLLADTDVKLQVELIQMPIFYASALSLTCQLDAEVDEALVRRTLQEQQGLELLTPVPLDTCGTNVAPEHDTIPVCLTQMGGDGRLNLWSVIDNLRKGSALNAVQIAELFIAR
ncbi:MAG: Asd/ArgC dimerization domain-containing protein [Desulfuromonadaceae bacterium]|nr:Asd/ArgC dimerization domain-containing protein [Desulfuromonadaceae bacterium]